MSYIFTWTRDRSSDLGGSHFDWEEDCLVTYGVFGKYIPAKTNAPMEECYPAEYPEIEIESVINSEGEDIAEDLSVKEDESVRQDAEADYSRAGYVI